ncbi:MAG: hypothetical protein HFE73_06220 [Firmicutes bacterium]|nr:hypothetical protein [Bacillota bacterium]
MTESGVMILSHYEDKEHINQQSGEETVQHSRRRKKEAEQRNKHEKHDKKKRSQRSAEASETSQTADGTHKKQKKKKKYRMNWKRFILVVFCLCLLVGVAGVGYVASIISKAPDIDTSNIYSMLSQSSVLYDANGEVMDSVVGADGQNRTIVEINQIPKNLQNAFIALEDKTFRTHHGFNIVRIFGAIKEAVFTGSKVGGTSTITQQLARNIYLQEDMFTRSMTRKITEAYYAIILEDRLSKDQILETYLNTVNFGDSLYGVQAAAQAYFSKDVSELTLAECAILAAIPQSPNYYKPVMQVSANDINDETENLILKDGDVAYTWNDTAAGRVKICLDLMLEQELISQKQHDKAVKKEIKDIVNPNTEALSQETNYFADYVINEVVKDLQEEMGYDYEKAHNMVYSGGLKIHTTLDPDVQKVIEKEFKNDANFPTLITNKRDGQGNIVDDFGKVLLYKYGNYITNKGYFRLKPNEYEWNSDGSLKVYAGKRLNFYDTTVQGQADVSVEFKNMYVIDNNTFYTIAGGYINIPQGYKTKDKDGNLIVDAKFFEDYPDVIKQSGERVVTKNFTLQQRVIQPQAAMTIIDNETGHVKAMVGGRKVSGRMILNRAVATRQSGSSIKPLSVYAAAIQRSFELQAAGETFPLTDSKFGFQGDNLWGNYLTAGSIIDDEPTTVNGKRWPVNSPPGFNGLLTMRVALQKSLNICAVKIMQQVGTDYCFDLVEKFGISTLVREGDVNDNNLAALALGGQSDGVTTLEMASAYTTFVNGGVHKEANVYTKVTTRNDDILLESTTKEDKVLDPGVAWIMRDMLQSVVTNGLGGPAAVSGASAGGKTGTTSDQFDIWFDGFTAKYSAALWIGSDINIKLSSMSGTAAALWGKIMNQVPGVASGTYSAKPSNVVSVSIDTKSGMLATEASGSDTRTEYFTSGTQPTEPDTVHQVVEVCDDTGYLATPSCPHVSTKTGIQRPYTPNKQVADIKRELPHYYCNEHNPDPKEYPVKKGLDVTIVEPGELDDDPNENDDPWVYDPNEPIFPPDDPNDDPDDPNHPDDPDDPSNQNPPVDPGDVTIPPKEEEV